MRWFHRANSLRRLPLGHVGALNVKRRFLDRFKAREFRPSTFSHLLFATPARNRMFSICSPHAWRFVSTARQPWSAPSKTVAVSSVVCPSWTGSCVRVRGVGGTSRVWIALYPFFQEDISTESSRHAFIVAADCQFESLSSINREGR